MLVVITDGKKRKLTALPQSSTHVGETLMEKPYEGRSPQPSAVPNLPVQAGPLTYPIHHLEIA